MAIWTRTPFRHLSGTSANHTAMPRHATAADLFLSHNMGFPKTEWKKPSSWKQCLDWAVLVTPGSWCFQNLPTGITSAVDRHELTSICDATKHLVIWNMCDSPPKTTCSVPGCKTVKRKSTFKTFGEVWVSVVLSNRLTHWYRRPCGVTC